MCIAVNDQIYGYNAVLADEAKANGVNLTDDDVITMDGYIAYRNAIETNADTAAFANYAEFENYVAESTGADVSVLHDAVKNVVKVVLETETRTSQKQCRQFQIQSKMLQKFSESLYSPFLFSAVRLICSLPLTHFLLFLTSAVLKKSAHSQVTTTPQHSQLRLLLPFSTAL